MSTARALSTLMLALASGVVVVASVAVRKQGRSTHAKAASPALSITTGVPSAAANPVTATTTVAPEQSKESCLIADHGWGDYEPWKTAGVARLLIPKARPKKHFDLLLHFHGGGPIRKLLAPLNSGLVIAAVDAGQGSRSYAEAFYGPESLEMLVANCEAALAPARMRHLIVSAWSAGYGAVRELLRFHPDAIDAAVLLDAVHASYRDNGVGLQEADIESFVVLGEQAFAKETVFVLTHSEIQPPNYASTSEVANYLIEKLGGQRRYAGLETIHGVQVKTQFRAGDFYVRGYTGTSKEAHCAHLKMLPGILQREILPALQP